MSTATATGNLSQTDFSHFAGLRLAAKKDPDASLKKVSREFEALFVQMMLKAAREAGGQDGMLDNHESRLYHEMFDDQMALSIAEKGNLGIEDMLRKQFASSVPKPGKDAAASAIHELKLPERKTFPDVAMPYVPAPEVEGNDEVVDVTRWNSPQAGSTSAAPEVDRTRFTTSLREHAARAAARLGTTPDILIAQAALETGWGKHVMPGTDGQSSNNFFSIKADPSWTGDTVKHRTLEFVQGRAVNINAGFRSYAGVGQAFDDYAEFISQNPRYQRALENARDPRAYVQELQRAGYATDPQYAQKILQIHQQVAAVGSDRRG